MSTLLRQRKPVKHGDGDPPTDDPVSCNSPSSESSWENSLDADDDDHQCDVTKTPPLSKLDRFLSTYGAFTSQTFTADQGLKIIQWSSWAISYATKSSAGSQLSPGLRVLYNDVSFTRYVLRFFGFFQSLEGYRSGSWAGGTWDDALIAKVAKYLMAGSMMLYYPLEHVAYAGWKMPKLVRVDANRISAVSCVFWTTYIVGDFWVSCLKWRELKGKLASVREIIAGKRDNVDDEKDAIVELSRDETAILGKMRHVKLQIMRCLLFILPAVNWSLPNWATDPLLSELKVNGLMLVEAYTSVYQSLRSMCG